MPKITNINSVKITNTDIFTYRSYRCITYRQFVRWTYGVSGRYIQVPLLACVMQSVWVRFPPQEKDDTFEGLHWPDSMKFMIRIDSLKYHLFITKGDIVLSNRSSDVATLSPCQQEADVHVADGSLIWCCYSGTYKSLFKNNRHRCRCSCNSLPRHTAKTVVHTQSMELESWCSLVA